MKLILVLTISLISFSGMTQIPDWTKLSCNGNTYTMYDELSAGNTVILDFSAYWCGPCHLASIELQSIWETYGEGTMNVRLFHFLFEDLNSNPTTCATVDSFAASHSLTYPGFADCIAEYNIYNTQYGSNSIPLILVFVPNPLDPSASTLVYNYTSGLGSSTGDISDDITGVLANNGFYGLGIEDISNPNKTLVKIIDLLGREIKFTPNVPLINVYDDGTTERIFIIE